jgi:hypothetical protein
MARLDCGDAKRDLGWRPVADGETFRRLGIDVHGKGVRGTAVKAWRMAGYFVNFFCALGLAGFIPRPRAGGRHWFGTCIEISWIS